MEESKENISAGINVSCDNAVLAIKRFSIDVICLIAENLK